MGVVGTGVRAEDAVLHVKVYQLVRSTPKVGWAEISHSVMLTMSQAPTMTVNPISAAFKKLLAEVIIPSSPLEITYIVPAKKIAMKAAVMTIYKPY